MSKIMSNFDSKLEFVVFSEIMCIWIMKFIIQVIINQAYQISTQIFSEHRSLWVRC